ncbi:hypothetical protein SAZ11_44515 [Streptomyces sp. FXJ1.4098]|nr:hypothetical protein [Streptomyces sp. FXJ1.4098]
MLALSGSLLLIPLALAGAALCFQAVAHRHRARGDWRPGQG